MGSDFLHTSPRASELYVLIQAPIGEFAVANSKDIEWNALAFKSLAIEEDKEMVLQGLVKSYQSGSGKLKFDDVIEGKGKGLVFLL